MMTLRELLTENLPGMQAEGDLETQISDLASDSKRVPSGALFFCVPGLRVDGHDFAASAVKSGAVALVVERLLPLDVPQIIVPDVREAMSRLGSAFFGHPSRKMKMVGITGTKGKTTVAYLLREIGKACGLKTGMMGTVVTMIGETELPSTLTTPDPIDLQRTLARMADEGVEMVAMEVSAHALALRKLEGIVFDAAVFTNFSQDHLDFFQTMDRYAAAKQLLFMPQRCRQAAFNVDAERADFMRERASGVPSVTYGVSSAADIYANDIEIQERGVSFLMTLDGEQHEVRATLSGIFNVYNCLAAAAAAHLIGLPAQGIVAGLEHLRQVPGRVEQLDIGTPFSVILDYAHSPDSLINILSSVRQFTKGRLIVVFGCGGGRDREKRPVMGEIAGKLADFTVLTSDNPRSENPDEILAAIEKGIAPTGAEYVVIENRRAAIAHALDIARPHDMVVLAGKGHETYQEISGVKNPFDEREVVLEWINRKRA